MPDFIPHLLFLTLFWTSCYAISGRIVGGNVAKPGEFPSTIAVIRMESDKIINWCTGSIISTVYILSASHCFTLEAMNYIMAGDIELYGSSQYRQICHIKKFIIHPVYLRSSHETAFDLALALLDSPLILNEYVQIIPLAEQAPDTDTICTNAGWGSTTLSETGDAPENSVLRYHVVKVVGYYDCFEKFLNPHMICTFSKNSTGYKGDSGGPLICNKKLSGVLATVLRSNEPTNHFANAPLASIWIRSNGTEGGCSRLGAYVLLNSIWRFSSILIIFFYKIVTVALKYII